VIFMQAIDFKEPNRQVDIKELQAVAAQIRENILRMLGEAKSGHPGGSLSCTDILVAIYFGRLRHDPKNPKWPDRDRLLLSKGHAAPALYSVLSKCGYIPEAELMTLRKMGSRLQGHPDPNKVPGVEIPGGPEGIGLSEGVGMALASRLDQKPIRIYVVTGDGELDEGEVWEAAMAAVKFKLDNIVAIVDRNGLQQEGTTMQIMPTDSVAAKFRAFNWNVLEVDGHNIQELLAALDKAALQKGVPTVIVAQTKKGKGVDYMEGVVKYHGNVPSGDMLENAIKQVRASAGGV
jgi:transketolase